jgi:hypothetical protein
LTDAQEQSSLRAIYDANALPAPEAFAEAIAMQAHQHAAAVPEDAPRDPVQGTLPIPRPPFDFARAFASIVEKRQEVDNLAKFYDTLKKRTAEARSEWDEATRELLAMILQADKERIDAESGAQGELPLTHGPECAWERAHPGEVCGICATERAAARETPHAEDEAARADDTTTGDEPLVEFPERETEPVDETDNAARILPRRRKGRPRAAAAQPEAEGESA